MTALFGGAPTPAVVTAPAAPLPGNPSAAQAGQQASIGQGTGYGYASTILGPGRGDMSQPTLAKKMLLGGG